VLRKCVTQFADCELIKIANRQDSWFTGFSSESYDFESSETPLNHAKSPSFSQNQENLLPRSPAHMRRLPLQGSQLMASFDRIDSIGCESTVAESVTGTAMNTASLRDPLKRAGSDSSALT
jgi:hypothetical protein